MPNQWYLSIQAETIGPLSYQAVVGLLRAARLIPSDFAWTEGMSQWERLGNLPEFSSALPSLSAMPSPTRPDLAIPAPATDPAITEAVEIREKGATERRFWVLRMARVRLTATAHLTSGGTNPGSFPVYDLSESGLFLISGSSPPAVGTKLRLKLESAEIARPLELSGTVARVGHSGGGEAGFAIRFEGIAASERILIQELVKAKHVKSPIL